MGWFCASVQLKTGDRDAVLRAVRGYVAEHGGGAFVAPVLDGWVSVYPNEELLAAEFWEVVAEGSGVEHSLLFDLHDSSVLRYWYMRAGEVVDYFNSCPDYFGEAEEEDLAAEGDPSVFDGLLDAEGRARLGEIVRPRVIDGEEVGGEPPVFEEERLSAIAAVLGIRGVLGSFDYLRDGEAVEDGVGADAMELVGEG